MHDNNWLPKTRRTVRLSQTVEPKDDGTIWTFCGEVYGGERDGAQVLVAVDHRMARPIVDALIVATDTDRVLIEAEDWQIMPA
jgi:hypothetical protein